MPRWKALFIIAGGGDNANPSELKTKPSRRVRPRRAFHNLEPQARGSRRSQPMDFGIRQRLAYVPVNKNGDRPLDHKLASSWLRAAIRRCGPNLEPSPE